jgi:hypothetical protein
MVSVADRDLIVARLSGVVAGAIGGIRTHTLSTEPQFLRLSCLPVPARWREIKRKTKTCEKCHRRDSNPHAHHGAPVFETGLSASSITMALSEEDGGPDPQTRRFALLSRHAWSLTSSSSIFEQGCEARGSHPANPACHTGVFTSSLASRGAVWSRTSSSCLSGRSGEPHRPAPGTEYPHPVRGQGIEPCVSPCEGAPVTSWAASCTSAVRGPGLAPGFRVSKTRVLLLDDPRVGRGARNRTASRVRMKNRAQPGTPRVVSPVGIKPTTSGFGNQRSLR